MLERAPVAHLGNDQSGQAVIEYVLMLAIALTAFLVVARGLSVLKVEERLMRPLSQSYAKTYQYGHPEASGYGDEDGPKRHPRAVVPGSDNFRIFINSGAR